MSRHFHRYFSLAGLVAYAVYASGITAALHEALAHGCDLPVVSLVHTSHAATHDHGRDDHSHSKSHNPECTTCYQLASAANATLILCTALPQFGEHSKPCRPGRFELIPATQVLSSIAPRAPPLA